MGNLALFDANLPVSLSSDSTGIAMQNTFASEFGCVTYSSFESMSATLEPEHWGLHAGMKGTVCKGKDCPNENPLSERNYPCDNILITWVSALARKPVRRNSPFANRQLMVSCPWRRGVAQVLRGQPVGPGQGG